MLINPSPVTIMGEHFLLGRQVNRHGELIPAPYDYLKRHPQGDGVRWIFIPLPNVRQRIPLVMIDNRLEHDED